MIDFWDIIISLLIFTILGFWAMFKKSNKDDDSWGSYY